MSHRQHVILQETMNDPNCKILLKLLMEEGAYNPFSNTPNISIFQNKDKKVKKEKKSMYYKIKSDKVIFYSKDDDEEKQIVDVRSLLEERKLGKYKLPTYFILRCACDKWISNYME